MDHLHSPLRGDMATAAAAASCHLVALPYPGRGHINAMMCLSRLLAARGALVTFVVTEEWLALLLATPSPALPPGLRLRTIPNVIPSEEGRANDFPGFLDAVYTKMSDPFECLLDELEPPRPTAIVSDSYLPWAVEMGNRRGIPVASLFPMQASFFSVLYHFDRIPAELLSPAVAADDITGEELLAQWVPGLTSLKLSDFKAVLSMERPLKRALEVFSWVRKAQALLFTSFYELEPRAFDALRSEFPFPVYPIGPCIPYMTPQPPNDPVPGNDSSVDYLEWLDSQADESVMYVSMGSFLSASSSQMEEIAMGLLASGTKFVWATRSDSSRIREIICSDEMGLIVPWCDQLKLLRHRSVGGFLTHCGLNSALEAVFAGVPMLTFPLTWDQPPVSRLVVEEWKVGLSLKGNKLGKEDVVGREDIAVLARRLMDPHGVERKEMKRRVKELQAASLKGIQEGGVSHANIAAFLKGINHHEV